MRAAYSWNAPRNLPESLDNPGTCNLAIIVIENAYISGFIFISLVKYIYLDEVSGVMHALGKWIASDPLFDAMGPLILGTGLVVLASLAMYASGFLS